MKNTVLWAMILCLLPVVALGLAAMPDSVTVITSAGQTEVMSFFGTLSDGSMPVGLALGGSFCVVTAVVAIIWAVSKRNYWLSGVLWCALGTATLSVMPLLLRTEPVVIPNVGVAILLCAEALIAYLHKRKCDTDVNRTVKGS